MEPGIEPVLDEVVAIEVLALSGGTVANLKLPGDASVAELKDRIADSSGISSSMQSLALPSRELEDGERLSSLNSTEIGLILIIKESPPIDFKINGRQFQITSVRVRSGDEVVDAHLHESPKTILARLEGGNRVCDGRILFWNDIPMDGAEPIRQILVEILAHFESQGATPQLDGSVVPISVKANPSPLPQSSLLFGLPSGKFFGTHPVGVAHPNGTWGWIRLADDNVCGLRVMSHPTCGNTMPSGAFLAEYLGTVTRRTRIEEGTRTYHAARLFASRSLPPRDGNFEASCEVVHLGRGRIAVHQHAPLVALEVRAAPDFDLISVKTDGVEIITIPYAGVLLPDGGQALPPPDALPSGENFLQVSSCAHLNRAPKRYDPSWFERKMRELMFGS